MEFTYAVMPARPLRSLQPATRPFHCLLQVVCMTDVLRLQDIKRACGTCSLRELCLPFGISEADLERLESIVQRKRPITKGQRLFTQGDPLTAIYAVRLGSVKSFTLSPEGAEQVTGFHFRANWWGWMPSPMKCTMHGGGAGEHQRVRDRLR